MTEEKLILEKLEELKKEVKQLLEDLRGGKLYKADWRRLRNEV